MNKRFEAVPRKVWRSNNPDKDILDNDVRIIEIDGITHVLVPIEEQSISPEFAQKLFDAFRLYAHDEYGAFVSDYIIQDFIKFHLPTSPKDTGQTKEK